MPPERSPVSTSPSAPIGRGSAHSTCHPSRLPLVPTKAPYWPVTMTGTGVASGLFGEIRDVMTTSRCLVAVVRSAVLTPDGAAVVEHHVDRATRADLGIFRRRIAGGELVRVADPVAWDDAYGATWTTDLVATAD